MTLNVKLFASVREAVGSRAETVEMSDGTTVGGLWQSYVSRYPKLANLSVAYAVNHEYAGAECLLKDGDEVAFIPPVSGG
jgi:molybdopterin converting factor subunit 1